MRRALVTGVTGFVGSHLTRRLLSQGVEVHALVRAASRVDRIPDVRDRIHLHVDEGGDLGPVVQRAAPDRCFHLATHFVAEHARDDVAALIHDNVAFPARLADALARAGLPSFVNVGTAWQHVDGKGYRPKNLYAATKQAFEDLLAYYAVTGGLRPVTVNLYDTYGPLDQRGKLVAALIRAVRTGDELSMSSGQQLIDLVHVDDAVTALLLASDIAGPSCHAASSGRPITLRELVTVIGRIAGKEVPVSWGARPDRPGEMVEHWDAGPPVPGWAPAVDLETGLRQLLAD